MDAGTFFIRWRMKFRLRYWRGHNLHSPLAYGIKREVMMKNGSECGSIYNVLAEKGIDTHTAGRIQSLADHLNIGSCVLNSGEAPPGSLSLITEEYSPENSAAADIVCIISPYVNRKRWNACKSLISLHYGMSIDCRDFLLIFNDDSLNKKHIKL